jgi:hypothetical protein
MSGLMFVNVPPNVLQQFGGTVAKDLLLERFKQVVTQRFGAQIGTGALAAAIDGPVPIGDIITAGIGVVTLYQIYQEWDSLWNETARQVQQEQPQTQPSSPPVPTTQTVRPITPTAPTATTTPQQTANQDLAQRQAVSQLYLNFDANLPASVKADLDSFYQRLARENPEQFARIEVELNSRYGQVATTNNDAALTNAILRAILTERYTPSNYQYRSEQRQAATQAYFQFADKIPGSTRADLDSFFQRLQREDPGQVDRVWSEVQKRYGQVATGNDNQDLARAILYNVLMQWYKPENYQFRSEQRQVDTQAYLRADQQLSPQVKADIDAFYQELRLTNPAQADRILSEMQQRYGRSATRHNDGDLAAAILRGVIGDWYTPANYQGKSRGGVVLDPPRPLTPPQSPPQEEAQPTTPPGDVPPPEQPPEPERKPPEPPNIPDWLRFEVSKKVLEELERLLRNPDEQERTSDEPIRLPSDPPVVGVPGERPRTDPVPTEANQQENPPTDNQQEGGENPPESEATEPMTEQEKLAQKYVGRDIDSLTDAEKAEFGQGYQVVETENGKHIRRNQIADGYPPLHLENQDGHWVIQEGESRASERESNPTEMNRNFKNAYGEKPEGYQIHHLTPDQVWQESKLTQEAAERGIANVDDAENLIALPGTAKAFNDNGAEVTNLENQDAAAKLAHPGSHPRWNDYVKEVLEQKQKDLEARYGSLDNVPDDVLRQAIREIQQELRQAIQRAAEQFRQGDFQNLPDWVNPTYKLKDGNDQLFPKLVEVPQANSIAVAYEVTSKEFRANISRLNDAIASLPVPPTGYPKTWSAADRPKDLLNQKPVSERDQAFVLVQAFLQINQKNGYRPTGADQVTTNGQYFATSQFDNGQFEVYRTNDYLPFLQIDPQGNVSLLRPLNEEESNVVQGLQPRLLAATLPPEVQQPRGFDRS